MVTESRLVEHKESTLTIRGRQQGDSNKLTVETGVDFCIQTSDSGLRVDDNKG